VTVRLRDQHLDRRIALHRARMQHTLDELGLPVTALRNIVAHGAPVPALGMPRSVAGPLLARILR